MLKYLVQVRLICRSKANLLGSVKELNIIDFKDPSWSAFICHNQTIKHVIYTFLKGQAPDQIS